MGEMSVTDTCRLCLSKDNLVWVFDKRFDNEMKYVVLVTTGVEIHATDAVSQKICEKCCHVIVKMFEFRKKSLENDKHLKEELKRLRGDKTDTPPQNGEIPLPAVIQIKQEIPDEIPMEVIKKPSITMHPTVREVFDRHPNVKLPKVALLCNVRPMVTMPMDAVENYFRRKKLDFNEHCKLALKPKRTARKKTAAFAESPPCHINGEIIPQKCGETRKGIIQPIKIKIIPKLQMDHVEPRQKVTLETEKSLETKELQNIGDTTAAEPIIPKLVTNKNLDVLDRRKVEEKTVNESDKRKVQGEDIVDSVRQNVDVSNVGDSPTIGAKTLAELGIQRIEETEPCHKKIKLSNDGDSSTRENETPMETETKTEPQQVKSKSLSYVANVSVPLNMCNICDSVLYSPKDLKKHRYKHLRCQFCKTTFKSMGSKEQHLAHNCIIKKTLNSAPCVALAKVEEDGDIVEKYRSAFYEYPLLVKGSTAERCETLVLSSDSETETPKVPIWPVKIEKEAEVAQDIIEILSDDEAATRCPQKVVPPPKVQNVPPAIKPDVSIKNNPVPDLIGTNTNELVTLKNLLTNHRSIALSAETAVQTDMPQPQSLVVDEENGSAVFNNLEQHLHVFRVPVDIKNGAFGVSYKYSIDPPKPKNMQLWNDLIPVDVKGRNTKPPRTKTDRTVTPGKDKKNALASAATNSAVNLTRPQQAVPGGAYSTSSMYESVYGQFIKNVLDETSAKSKRDKTSSNKTKSAPPKKIKTNVPTSADSSILIIDDDSSSASVIVPQPPQTNAPADGEMSFGQILENTLKAQLLHRLVVSKINASNASATTSTSDTVSVSPLNLTVGQSHNSTPYNVPQSAYGTSSVCQATPAQTPATHSRLALLEASIASTFPSGRKSTSPPTSHSSVSELDRSSVNYSSTSTCSDRVRPSISKPTVVPPSTVRDCIVTKVHDVHVGNPAVKDPETSMPYFVLTKSNASETVRCSPSTTTTATNAMDKCISSSSVASLVNGSGSVADKTAGRYANTAIVPTSAHSATSIPQYVGTASPDPWIIRPKLFSFKVPRQYKNKIQLLRKHNVFSDENNSVQSGSNTPSNSKMNNHHRPPTPFITSSNQTKSAHVPSILNKKQQEPNPKTQNRDLATKGVVWPHTYNESQVPVTTYQSTSPENFNVPQGPVLAQPTAYSVGFSNVPVKVINSRLDSVAETKMTTSTQYTTVTGSNSTWYPPVYSEPQTNIQSHNQPAVTSDGFNLPILSTLLKTSETSALTSVAPREISVPPPPYPSYPTNPVQYPGKLERRRNSLPQPPSSTVQACNVSRVSPPASVSQWSVSAESQVVNNNCRPNSTTGKPDGIFLNSFLPTTFPCYPPVSATPGPSMGCADGPQMGQIRVKNVSELT